MNHSRKLIATSGLLVAGLIVVAATGQNHVGCGIRALSHESPEAGAATVEFRVDRMTGESITVRRVAADGASAPSVIRTRTRKMGAVARCSATGGSNAHFVVGLIGPAPKAEFQGEGPVRVVVSTDAVELASGMVSAAHGSEIKLTW
jgi:hypothetical protein